MLYHSCYWDSSTHTRYATIWHKKFGVFWRRYESSSFTSVVFFAWESPVMVYTHRHKTICALNRHAKFHFFPCFLLSSPLTFSDENQNTVAAKTRLLVKQLKIYVYQGPTVDVNARLRISCVPWWPASLAKSCNFHEMGEWHFWKPAKGLLSRKMETRKSSFMFFFSNGFSCKSNLKGISLWAWVPGSGHG